MTHQLSDHCDSLISAGELINSTLWITLSSMKQRVRNQIVVTTIIFLMILDYSEGFQLSTTGIQNLQLSSLALTNLDKNGKFSKSQIANFTRNGTVENVSLSKIDYYWSILCSTRAKIVMSLSFSHSVYFLVLSRVIYQVKSTTLDNFGKFSCHTLTVFLWLRNLTSLMRNSSGLF